MNQSRCQENRFPPNSTLNYGKWFLYQQKPKHGSKPKKEGDTFPIRFGTLSRLAWETVLLFVFLVGLSFAEAAPEVSSEELFKNAQEYDGKAVIYKGEVIGDIMVRGNFAWINVRDKTGVLGVFCPQELLGGIEYKGSYSFSGDVVVAQGSFQRFCPEHGGDTDIHAEKISVIRKGKTTPRPLEPQKVKASIILAAITFILAIIHMVVRRFR